MTQRGTVPEHYTRINTVPQRSPGVKYSLVNHSPILLQDMLFVGLIAC